MPPSLYVRVPRQGRPPPGIRAQRSPSPLSSAIPSSAVAEAASAPERPELDEEGLLRDGYDAVLVGTGLVQSILASALSRAGRTVLHCDAGDRYGEAEAGMDLRSMGEWVAAARRRRKAEAGESTTTTTIRGGGGEDGDSGGGSGGGEIPLNPDGSLSGLIVHACSDLSDGDGIGGEAPLAVGTRVTTPLGEGIVASLPDDVGSASSVGHGSLGVRLDGWTLADGTKPTSYFGYELREGGSLEGYLEDRHGIVSERKRHFREMTDQGQRFALDLTPAAIYSVGPATDGVVKSGVSDYVEFKTVEGLYVLAEKEDGGGKGKGKGKRGRTWGNRLRAKRAQGGSKDKEKGEENDVDGGEYGEGERVTIPRLKLSRVPCSKSEVFKSSLLGPLDKRRLMKFLQLASDYAVARGAEMEAEEAAERGSAAGERGRENGEDEEEAELTVGGRSIAMVAESSVESIHGNNERELRMGRSLGRPQNKAVSMTALDTLLQRQRADDGTEDEDFDAYLRTEHGLPDGLRGIVVHAMAMGSPEREGEDRRYPTTQAMDDLSRHLSSLGRYGATGFLLPMYGGSELPQAFCRSAAVHGATYLLRRAARAVALSRAEELKGDVGVSNKRVRGIVLSPDGDSEGSAAVERVIKSLHVIVPAGALPQSDGDGADIQSREQRRGRRERRTLRRISILRGGPSPMTTSTGHTPAAAASRDLSPSYPPRPAVSKTRVRCMGSSWTRVRRSHPLEGTRSFT